MKAMLCPSAKATAPGVLLLFSLLLLGFWACGVAPAPPIPAVAVKATPVPTLAAPAPLAPVQEPRQPTAQPETATPTNAPPISSGRGPTRSVPVLDRSLHTVPLMDILFDTFGGSPRFLPLDMATDDFIDGLRDAIRPIDSPIYGSAADLPWLDDDNLVIGYRSGGGAYAYPVNILEFHEIVNDDLDGISVLITYCPLCFSGVVFSREIGGEVLTFGNTSALYNSDLVMYDKQTGSYWFQVGARPLWVCFPAPALTCCHPPPSLGESGSGFSPIQRCSQASTNPRKCSATAVTAGECQRDFKIG